MKIADKDEFESRMHSAQALPTQLMQSILSESHT